ncbi:MAG: hypothetical protein EHM21_02565 [Chloroflexi bacterium]|nr:MAG: hypothetical protein EHM21_02565 [Chloroflexota bacterium]
MSEQFLMDQAVPNSRERTSSRVLKVVCALLILFVTSHLLLQVASIPAYYQRVTSGTVPTLVIGGEELVSNALVAQWAEERGMSLRTYAIYSIILNLIIALGCVSIAGLILWKARSEWFNWFTALVLIFIPSGGLWEFTIVSRIAFPFITLGGMLWPAFLVFLYLFPNGRAVPRWTRWPMVVLVALHLAIQSTFVAVEWGLASDEMLETAQTSFPIIEIAFLFILFSQVYRYARVSTPVEKAQTRWFIAGLVFWIVTGTIIELVTGQSSSEATTETGLGGDLNDLLMLVIPLSIGIGILRYRLYDIDVIIRRTLVYSLLTALLALMYFGSVLVIQPIARALTGGSEQSPLVIVLSTLAVAALFNPLRLRIQNFINRRFYRQRYNMDATLQAFAGTVRNEVNLENLNHHMLSVVQETIQPTHISLWLRDTAPTRKTQD